MGVGVEIEIAAAKTTAELEQRRAPREVIDPSRDRRQTERARNGDAGPADLQRDPVRAQGRHPCAVQLQAMDPGPREPVKGSETPGDLVDDDLHATLDEGVESAGIRRDEGALGDPDLEATGRYPAVRDESEHVVDEFRMEHVMAQGPERHAQIRIGRAHETGEVGGDAAESRARQRNREAGGLGDSEKLGRADLAAYRVDPAKIADRRDPAAGLEVVAAHIVQANVAAGDRFAQLASAVEPGERTQAKAVAEEVDPPRSV